MKNIISSVRQSSTLADKLRAAASTNYGREMAKLQATEASSSEGGFNELFVMPKRKLRGQMQIEQATGRVAYEERSRPDLHERLSVRKERSAEMETDQDWPSVWPAARSFNASVVPLPVRMGARPDVEKRAPFKKQSNLELVKIPNFLHLTPVAIQRHCEAIKQFCTDFPKELEDSSVLEEHFPVAIEYHDYVHQGTNIRDIRSRVITMQVKVASLELDARSKEKLIRLAGKRYDETTDTITFITDRCHTRKQNFDYANYLLTAIYGESKKKEAWEKMRERQDNLKVEFDGSKCKENLLRTLQSEGKQVEDKKLAEFEQMWTTYRNTEETPEATRQYAQQMKQLLGIKPLSS